ncbi:MAG: hypothetical protein ABFS21_00715 [Actinomycetota bacterium]
MRVFRFVDITALVLVAALLAVGCDGSSTESTVDATAGNGSGVEFGKGSVPETVPDSFPIPEQAVVGTTLIDTNRGVTEMVLTLPAALPAAVEYYDENLPARGYEISSSDGTETKWSIEFAGEGLTGIITVNSEGSGLSSATVRLTSV